VGTDFLTTTLKPAMERDKNSDSRIPQNDPSKAMDSKSDVARSNDPKIDQDFPGYPHYPAKEDIMDQRTDSHRVDMDVENLASGPNRSGLNQRFANETEQRHPVSDRNREEEESPEESAVLNTSADEIGTPQNVSNEDLDEARNSEEEESR